MSNQIRKHKDPPVHLKGYYKEDYTGLYKLLYKLKHGGIHTLDKIYIAELYREYNVPLFNDVVPSLNEDKHLANIMDSMFYLKAKYRKHATP